MLRFSPKNLAVVKVSVEEEQAASNMNTPSVDLSREAAPHVAVKLCSSGWWGQPI